MVEYNKQIGRLFSAPVEDPLCVPAEADDDEWTEEGAEEEAPEVNLVTDPADEQEEDDEDYNDERWQPSIDAELAACCYHCARGRCWYDQRCRFWHAEVTREQRDRMVLPPLGSSRR